MVGRDLDPLEKCIIERVKAVRAKSGELAASLCGELGEAELIGDERQNDFLRLWTLKESFVKAEGKGLRISLKDYFFQKENSNRHGN